MVRMVGVESGFEGSGGRRDIANVVGDGGREGECARRW